MIVANRDNNEVISGVEIVSCRRLNIRLGPPFKLAWAWQKVNTLALFCVQKQPSFAREPIRCFISSLDQKLTISMLQIIDISVPTGPRLAALFKL